MRTRTEDLIGASFAAIVFLAIVKARHRRAESGSLAHKVPNPVHELLH